MTGHADAERRVARDDIALKHGVVHCYRRWLSLPSLQLIADAARDDLCRSAASSCRERWPKAHRLTARHHADGRIHVPKDGYGLVHICMSPTRRYRSVRACGTLAASASVVGTRRTTIAEVMVRRVITTGSAGERG